jgi:hypothetical protein
MARCRKASPQGVFADTLIATIEEDWAPEGRGVQGG